MSPRIITLIASFLFFGSTLTAQDPKVIEIGIVDSLVRDLSPGRKKLLQSDFPGLVEEFTGLKSKLIQGGGADQLASGKWHLGVFSGIEFAWAHDKNPKLQPLILAVNGDGPIHALLVVRKKSEAMDFKDLKGKNIDVLSGRLHLRLFMDKGVGGDAEKFFGNVAATSSGLEALNNVLSEKNKVQAAVVDTAAFDFYKEIHPGKHRELKVLAKSEVFPPTVIAYQKGSVSDKVLNKFREGMFKANDSERGREAMGNVNITAFKAVPADFPKLLASIIKAYPPPSK